MKNNRKNYTCIRLSDHENFLMNRYLEQSESGQKSVEIRKIFLCFLKNHFANTAIK